SQPLPGESAHGEVTARNPGRAPPFQRAREAAAPSPATPPPARQHPARRVRRASMRRYRRLPDESSGRPPPDDGWAVYSRILENAARTREQIHHFLRRVGPHHLVLEGLLLHRAHQLAQNL